MDNLLGKMVQAHKESDASKNRTMTKRAEQEEKPLASDKKNILNSLRGNDKAQIERRGDIG